MNRVRKFVTNFFSKKPIILEGGRKDMNAQKIKEKGGLGKGMEAKVIGVEVIIGNKKKTRSIELAEKQFYRSFSKTQFTFRDPEKHFKIYNALKKLNKSKGLGLRLPTTLRLRRGRFRKLSLIVTRYEILLNVEKVSKAYKPTPASIKKALEKDLEKYGVNVQDTSQYTSFVEDRNRQSSILEKHGFFINAPESFAPVFDLKEKRVIALLSDFGLVDKSRRLSKQS